MYHVTYNKRSGERAVSRVSATSRAEAIRLARLLLGAVGDISAVKIG